MKFFATVFLAASLAHRALAQTSSTPAVLIGGENSRGAELATIQDVAILPNLLVVIEESAPFIHVFDHSGRLRQTLGRKGAGPGEFEVPSAVTYDSVRREVLIVDRMSSRITRYRVEDTLALQMSFRTSVTDMRGVCVVGGKTYVLGQYQGMLIHELPSDAFTIDPARSFAAARTTHARAEHPMIKSRTDHGRLGCDPADRAIYLMNEFGDLHTVALASGATSLRHADGFVTLDMAPVDHGAIQFSLGQSGFWHDVLGFTRDQNGMSVVTGKARPGNGGSSGKSLSEFAMQRIVDGAVAHESISSRWQTVGRAANSIICMVQDPYPTIAYFRRDRCP